MRTIGCRSGSRVVVIRPGIGGALVARLVTRAFTVSCDSFCDLSWGFVTDALDSRFGLRSLIPPWNVVFSGGSAIRLFEIHIGMTREDTRMGGVAWGFDLQLRVFSLISNADRRLGVVMRASDYLSKRMAKE